ncbi:MAG: hypothetical protein A3K19_20460 [Lentisphaerae bacterium RIFOXYB12_FULL_65_16]|nr:MAG: hypothetical protein A3K18_32660 [Lentisphaerae bacterium RIFOXYA12_64_32]OGV89334.1 MAG: hypothetical protein A3K19_20460 [Lentisphaerae bacterium RIFOXYB12_FULL_65_16]
MPSENLKYKPLVEAILEVRWAVQRTPQGMALDPHYKLLPGRLFDRISGEYPVHEELPTAGFPDEIIGQVVQHRFRVASNAWPLIQVGPGVFTVNETADYTWADFRARCVAAVASLFDAYPKREDLKVQRLMLRYIDAEDFDHSSLDCLGFLKEKMKIDVSLPAALFRDGVESRPVSLNLHTSFASQSPKGTVNVRFATGQREGKRVLLWETMVQSASPDELPVMPDAFQSWVDAAHGITHRWFMTLIDGELKRKYSGV